MASLPDQLVELIRSGRNIEAIKVLREETGVDLRTAKEAVDKFDADPLFDPVSLSGKIADVSAEVKDLARAGERIAAIKLLMDSTGVNEMDAEQAVDQFLLSEENEAQTASSEMGEIPEMVRALAWEGQKISAIKALHEQSDLDLKGSKEVVDLLPVDPTIPQTPPRAAVFSIVIAAFLLAMGLALAVYLVSAAP